jgi:hypothetical protein
LSNDGQARSGLTDSPTLQQLDEQHNDQDDQEQVNEISRDAETETQGPHQQQHNHDRPQHKTPFKKEATNRRM